VLATDAVFVGIAVIAACAFAFSIAMRFLERWLEPWKGQHQPPRRAPWRPTSR
jgi:taurine transport system permease protein